MTTYNFKHAEVTWRSDTADYLVENLKKATSGVYTYHQLTGLGFEVKRLKNAYYRIEKRSRNFKGTLWEKEIGPETDIDNPNRLMIRMTQFEGNMYCFAQLQKNVQESQGKKPIWRYDFQFCIDLDEDDFEQLFR